MRSWRGDPRLVSPWRIVEKLRDRGVARPAIEYRHRVPQLDSLVTAGRNLMRESCWPLVRRTVLTTLLPRVRLMTIGAILILGLVNLPRTMASASLDDPPGRIQPPSAHLTTPAPDADPAWARQREAAEGGDAAAQFAIGTRYANGDGVIRDVAQAFQWWRRAADQGMVAAELNLAAAYQRGFGVQKDETEAIRWYRKAAEHGDSIAQLHVGDAYDVGHAVPLDAPEAVRWWLRAAHQGNPVAQDRLGQAYHDGNGVPKDFAQALAWFRKAAEQGHGQAQTNLGFMYQNGENVARDPELAVRWWRQAAERGNASALYNLAVAYYNGDGVREDYVEAYKWVELAAARASEERRPKYTALHTTLAGKMTPAQVADAQERIWTWRATLDQGPEAER